MKMCRTKSGTHPRGGDANCPHCKPRSIINTRIAAIAPPTSQTPAWYTLCERIGATSDPDEIRDLAYLRMDTGAHRVLEALTANQYTPWDVLRDILGHEVGRRQANTIIRHPNVDRDYVLSLGQSLLESTEPFSPHDGTITFEESVMNGLILADWTPAEVLRDIDSDDRIRESLRSSVIYNKSVPADVLERYVTADASGAGQASGHPNLPYERAVELTTPLPWTSRAWEGLAGRKDATPELLAHILTGTNPQANIIAARRPTCPTSALVDTYFRLTSSAQLRQAIIKRPDISADVAATAARHPNPKFRRFACASPHITLADLRALQLDTDKVTRARANDPKWVNLDAILSTQLRIAPDNTAALAFLRRGEWWTLTPESTKVKVALRMNRD